MASSTKILKKKKDSFAGYEKIEYYKRTSSTRVMKKSSTTGTFIIFQTLFSKGILTFVDPMPSFITYDGKRLPKNWIGTLLPLCSKVGDASNT